jgi:hypothetical protein
MMSAIQILELCSVAYVVIVTADAIRRRLLRRWLWQMLIWIGALAFVLFYFQAQGGRVAFGGNHSHVGAIGVIFVATVFGVAAHYLYYLEKITDFDWFSLVKPLLIAPIVILPLVGSLQQNATIETMQIVMLGLVAFQNGFFWRAVFEKAQVHAGG